jgi:hypothetical protein
MRPSRLRTFFAANPWWGFAGFVVGFIGIALTIYIYFVTREVPEIRYYVNPVRAVIAKAGVNSALSVLYNNQPVPDDVTSASIAIWNAGKKPVSASDVLAPLQIVLAQGHGILEAKLVSATRSVVGLQLEKSALDAGKVPLQFRILEHNDGGIVQLLYRGDPSVNVSMQGSVIGQPYPKGMVYAGRLQTQADQLRSNRNVFLIISAFAAASVVFTIVVTIVTRKRPPPFVIFFMVGLMVFTAALYLLEIPPGPPFEFG